MTLGKQEEEAGKVARSVSSKGAGGKSQGGALWEAMEAPESSGVLRCGEGQGKEF